MPDAIYRWNGGSERYIAPNGRYVSRASVRAVLDSVLDKQMADVRWISDALVRGQMSLQAWRDGMGIGIKTSHLIGSAVARGGWAQVDDATFQFVGARVRSELGYLQSFTDGIASGVIPLDGSIAPRAAMYVEAARSTHRQVEHKMGVDRGHTMEHNRLGGSRESCSECPALSALGWVPINSLPPPGARACRSRCRCTVATRAR